MLAFKCWFKTGVTIAQSLDTARQPDMPASAIVRECIDYSLTPDDNIPITIHTITSASSPEQSMQKS